MKLESQELLEEFHSMVKDIYTDVSFDQLKDICFGPWVFLKDEISSGELDEVRMQYFGVFKVHPKMVKAFKNTNVKLLASGKMTEKVYNQYNKMYENYFKKNPENI